MNKQKFEELLKTHKFIWEFGLYTYEINSFQDFLLSVVPYFNKEKKVILQQKTKKERLRIADINEIECVRADTIQDFYRNLEECNLIFKGKEEDLFKINIEDYMERFEDTKTELLDCTDLALEYREKLNKLIKE